MTVPPAIPPAPGPPAAKSQPKGRPAGQAVPREQSHGFQKLLEQESRLRHSAKGEAARTTAPVPGRKAELSPGERVETMDEPETSEPDQEVASGLFPAVPPPLGFRLVTYLQGDTAAQTAAGSSPALEAAPGLSRHLPATQQAEKHTDSLQDVLARASPSERAAHTRRKQLLITDIASSTPPGPQKANLDAAGNVPRKLGIDRQSGRSGWESGGITAVNEAGPDPESSTRRAAGLNRAGREPESVAAVPSGAPEPNNAKGGKRERDERSGGGATDVSPGSPHQAVTGPSAASLVGPARQDLAPEGAAQQILRHIFEAAPVTSSVPDTMDAQSAPRSMRLKLNPDNLGEVEIRITREGGQLTIRIRAEQRETAETLKNDSSILQERLEFISAADARVEIEFAGASDTSQLRDELGGMGENSQGGANRQAMEREPLADDASASRKPPASSQGDDAPDPGRQPARGRPDVLLL